jgi:hypothetical protein
VTTHPQKLPREIVAVWLLYLVDATVMLVTYTRLPARELYHVSGTGLTGGLSRVLSFSNFSTALVAIAILALLADRTRSRVTIAVAVTGVICCAAVVWPGVVDQADLDARSVNAIPGIGVLIALLLTALALRDGTAWSPRRAGDRVRIVVAVVAVVFALPWIAAESGFFLNDAPLLGRVFQTGRFVAGDPLPAVHHGHHHGLDGLLLLLTALLLSRTVPAMRHTALRVAVGLYLALMAVYGVANSANDFWTEQVIKRGWTTWAIPNVILPKVSIAWSLIVLGAAVLYALASSRTVKQPHEPPEGGGIKHGRSAKVSP